MNFSYATASPALITPKTAQRTESVYSNHTSQTLEVLAMQRQVLPLPTVRRFGKTWAFLDAHRPHAWMHNRVAELTEDDIHHLPEIASFYASAGVPLRVETLPSHFTSALGRSLAQLGLVVSNHDVAFAGYPRQDGLETFPESEIEVMHAKSQTELELHLQTRQAAFEGQPLVAEAVPIQLQRLRQPNLYHFTGRMRGEAAGTATLFVHEQTGYLALAGTIPLYRRQGLQQVLLKARVHLAAELGCDLVTGMTGYGESSGRNMQRAGLGLVQIRSIWTMAPPSQ